MQGQLTRRETMDLGKSIYWNDEVKIRIEGVSIQHDIPCKQPILAYFCLLACLSFNVMMVLCDDRRTST